MNTTFLGFALALFVALLMLMIGGYHWWNTHHGASARRFGRRLRAASEAAWESDAPVISKVRTLGGAAWFSNLLKKLPRVHTLDRLLIQSGLLWTVSAFLFMTLVPPVGVMLVAMMLGLPAPVTMALTLAWLPVPLWYVMRKRQRRLQRIEMQLPEGADLISRALRAGHSFSSALDMAGSELPEPLGAELRVTFDEINYGVSMHDALTNLAMRAPLPDLRYLVIAVLIQREAGGNLAEILGNVSRIIRERMKLAGQVRVLSAEGRLSGVILALMPFGVAGAMYLMNPEFLMPLWTDPVGPWILGYAFSLLVMGLIWMRRIVRIHV
ncbi:type II secretion system F family protein [Cupriavidus numazuensis]|uniref:Type II secretion system protein GspF domain-containing protein n=1 Tax=Cupriavidus numazuensis TaxID=221992 RepID=A0ABM8TP53_9BURK|nr:type II secretion system F family protein [Cupriavidus numazuensis]CAG2156812.1 hypothetical protein LMG26411_05373 [Cupriavidus numazuensis]